MEEDIGDNESLFHTRTGAWATDAAVCTKLFVKSGNRVSFARDASFVGGHGFIIEEGELRS